MICALNKQNNYIDNLKQANVSLDLKNATPEERSKAAVAMADANKKFKSSVEQTIKAKEPFILDGTAASLNKTRELKNELVNIQSTVKIKKEIMFEIIALGNLDNPNIKILSSDKTIDMDLNINDINQILSGNYENFFQNILTNE